jgi:hypothetical protein
VDGRRYDARSENISAGGMLLATAEEIPLGHTIALVFKSRSGKKTSGEKGIKYGAGIKGEPVYLVGRVMRKQVSPVPGVGLRWVRAMTDAATEDLEYFLSKMLRIEVSGAKRSRVGSNKAMKSVFEFEPLYQQAIKFSGTVEDDERTTGPILVGLDGEEDYFRELRFDDDFGHSTSEGPALPREQKKHGAVHRTSGPMTNMLRQSERLMPVNSDAILTIGAMPFPVHVTAIGLNGVFVESRVAPTNREEAVGLVMEIITRRETEKVRCRARVLSVDDGSGQGEPGIYLEFLEFANEAEKETLDQYVRWVHFRTVSSPPT